MLRLSAVACCRWLVAVRWVARRLVVLVPILLVALALLAQTRWVLLL